MFHRGAKPITAAERAHMERVRELGCCACSRFGLIYFAPVELHHLLSGGQRMGHMFVIPLCPPHHRGLPFTLYQQFMIPAEARVSIAHGSKAFARIYGTERELWEKVQRQLGLEAQWPETKVLPRRLA